MCPNFVHLYDFHIVSVKLIEFVSMDFFFFFHLCPEVIVLIYDLPVLQIDHMLVTSWLWIVSFSWSGKMYWLNYSCFVYDQYLCK